MQQGRLAEDHLLVRLVTCRGALEAGATREEILMILKIASLLSIHTASLGAPILLEEAKAAGVKPMPKNQ